MFPCEPWKEKKKKWVDGEFLSLAGVEMSRARRQGRDGA